MSFQWPEMLWLYLALPLLVAMYFYALSRKKKLALRYASLTLVKEAMARNVAVTQGKTRLEVKCSKCGAPNRVMAEPGETRVEYKCKECGHQQRTL